MLRIIDGSSELEVVQDEERLESGVADTFVAINDGTIRNVGVRESGGLLGEPATDSTWRPVV